MSALHNPLVTRSLPTGLWRWAPESIVNFDEQLRSQVVLSISMERSPWPIIHWLTQSPQGMGLSLLVIGALLWSKAKPSMKQMFWLVIFLGLSDFTSSSLKRLIGRLKPHVDFYNPAFTPALSFPSNHAFNTAFALGLLWVSLSEESRSRFQAIGWAGLFLVLFIGLSRVLFGQHYPLDVAAGWLLGGSLGATLAPVYRGISMRTSRKRA